MNNPKAQANDRAANSENRIEAKSSFGNDFIVALCFLSRLKIKPSKPDYSLANASRAFGVVGLLLGALTGLIVWSATAVGLAALPAVIIALAAGALITGGLHEDGLADVADGFGGGWTADRKLEIMRDSQIGTYGVLALVFSVSFRIAAYSSIVAADSSFSTTVFMFAAIGCLSRAPMALMMYQMPLARKDGRAAQAGAPSHDNLRYGLFVSVTAGALCLLSAVSVGTIIAVFFAVSMTFLAIGKIAKSQICGYTGDVLGTLQQSIEIFCLLALLIFI